MVVSIARSELLTCVWVLFGHVLTASLQYVVSAADHSFISRLTVGVSAMHFVVCC